MIKTHKMLETINPFQVNRPLHVLGIDPFFQATKKQTNSHRLFDKQTIRRMNKINENT